MTYPPTLFGPSLSYVRIIVLPMAVNRQDKSCVGQK